MQYSKITRVLFLSMMACSAGAQRLDFNTVLGVGKDLTTAATGVSEKDEIDIGRELAGRTLGAAPLVNDPNLQGYVNRVGRWIASQSERPDLPWRFGVMNHESVNAFAMPGGYVLITKGLYDLLTNEAQLAGVLGHEIAHIVKKHHISVMQKQSVVSAGGRVVQSQVRTSSPVASNIIQNVLGEGAIILSRSLDKSAEYEADAVGLVLASRAGYSPYGLIDVLHVLGARSGNVDKNAVTMYSTHPSAAERLEQLGEHISKRGVDKMPAGAVPEITPVASGVVAPRAGSAPASLPGARALTNEGSTSSNIAPAAPADKPAAGGIDAGSVIKGLKGLFGR